MTENQINQNLKYLKLPFMAQHYETLANQAAKENWNHVDYLTPLVNGEAALRQDRCQKRRIQMARFPVIKTLDQFNWTWPKKINRLQVQNLARLQFIKSNTNVIFLGGVGLGKTHLASAIGYAACLKGRSTLFAPAIDVINTLAAAQTTGSLKQELKKYTKPDGLFASTYFPDAVKMAEHLTTPLHPLRRGRGFPFSSFPFDYQNQVICLDEDIGLGLSLEDMPILSIWVVP